MRSTLMCSLPNCAELAMMRLRRSSLVSVRADLTREEAVAYDLASALVSGGVLPELTYQQAVDPFGEEGTAKLIYLVGLCCMVSVTLNGFDVPIPARRRRSQSPSLGFTISDIVEKVENRTSPKISRKLILIHLCCCAALQRRYEGRWSFLSVIVWSLMSPAAKCISGP